MLPTETCSERVKVRPGYRESTSVVVFADERRLEGRRVF